MAEPNQINNEYMEQNSIETPTKWKSFKDAMMKPVRRTRKGMHRLRSWSNKRKNRTQRRRRMRTDEQNKRITRLKNERRDRKRIAGTLNFAQRQLDIMYNFANPAHHENNHVVMLRPSTNEKQYGMNNGHGLEDWNSATELYEAPVIGHGYYSAAAASKFGVDESRAAQDYMTKIQQGGLKDGESHYIKYVFYTTVLKADGTIEDVPWKEPACYDPNSGKECERNSRFFSNKNDGSKKPPTNGYGCPFVHTKKGANGTPMNPVRSTVCSQRIITKEQSKSYYSKKGERLSDEDEGKKHTFGRGVNRFFHRDEERTLKRKWNKENEAIVDKAWTMGGKCVNDENNPNSRGSPGDYWQPEDCKSHGHKWEESETKLTDVEQAALDRTNFNKDRDAFRESERKIVMGRDDRKIFKNLKLWYDKGWWKMTDEWKDAYPDFTLFLADMHEAANTGKENAAAAAGVVSAAGKATTQGLKLMAEGAAKGVITFGGFVGKEGRAAAQAMAQWYKDRTENRTINWTASAKEFAKSVMMALSTAAENIKNKASEAKEAIKTGAISMYDDYKIQGELSTIQNVLNNIRGKSIDFLGRVGGPREDKLSNMIEMLMAKVRRFGPIDIRKDSPLHAALFEFIDWRRSEEDEELPKGREERLKEFNNKEVNGMSWGQFLGQITLDILQYINMDTIKAWKEQLSMLGKSSGADVRVIKSRQDRLTRKMGRVAAERERAERERAEAEQDGGEQVVATIGGRSRRRKRRRKSKTKKKDKRRRKRRRKTKSGGKKKRRRTKRKH